MQDSNEQQAWQDEARKLGTEAAEAAASWTVDGNSDRQERARVLAMLRDGDPDAYDYLPREPNLSGEYADDLTPRSLFEDITGLDAHAEATWSVDAYNAVVDALCDAYDEGVSETFSLACERELIAFCEEEGS
jgi:hypothetical protein